MKHLLNIPGYVKIVQNLVDFRKMKKALKIYKRIKKYEKQLIKFKYYVDKCNEWIKIDKKELLNEINKMSDEEVMEYEIKRLNA